MAVLELCLLPWLALQAPAPQALLAESPSAVATANTDPAAWLPAGTALAVMLRTHDEVDLPALWARVRAADPTGNVGRLERDWHRMLAVAGMTVSDLEKVARGGIAMGLTGFADGTPNWVCIADLSDASASLREALLQQLKVMEVAGGLFGDYLVLGSDDATIAAARKTVSSAAGLSAQPDYAAALGDTTLQMAPALTVFARPAALFDAVLTSLPTAQREMATRIGDALAIGSLQRTMLRVGVTNTGLQTAGSCSLPAADSPFARLFDGPPLTAALASSVPAAATSFSFSSADIGGFVQQAMALAADAEPMVDSMLKMSMGQLREQTGVELQRDVLEALSGIAVSLTLPTGQGTLIGLTDGKAFAATLDKLLQAGDVPVRRQQTDAGVSYHINGADVPTALAFGVAGNWLCLTDSAQTLTAVTNQITTAAPHAGAQRLLAQAAAGTTMTFATADGSSHGDCRSQDGQARFTSQVDFNTTPPDAAPTLAAVTEAPPQAPATGTSATGAPAPDRLVRALQQAEQDPTSAKAEDLARLARSTHVGVATRAAWLLGQREEPAILPMLGELASQSPHDEVRVQAMHALLRHGKQQSFAAATAGLDDTDMRVRTMAAQLLGRMRQAEATAPLLAALATRAQATSGTSPNTDIQAILLALADGESAEHLLPAAEAMNGSAANNAGQALTYCFQKLAPTLSETDQATLLVAVLDHSEPMLRRYAIGRLGELGLASTTKALEGRLATEGAELRPLVEVALTRVRQQQPAAEAEAAASSTTAASRWQQIRARWDALPAQQQMIVGGGAALCLALLLTMIIVLSRRRKAQRHAAAMELVQASEGVGLDEAEAFADADEAYYADDEDGEYAEGDFADNEDAEGEDADWSEEAEDEDWSALDPEGLDEPAEHALQDGDRQQH